MKENDHDINFIKIEKRKMLKILFISNMYLKEYAQK